MYCSNAVKVFDFALTMIPTVNFSGNFLSISVCHHSYFVLHNTKCYLCKIVAQSVEPQLGQSRFQYLVRFSPGVYRHVHHSGRHELSSEDRDGTGKSREEGRHTSPFDEGHADAGQ